MSKPRVRKSLLLAAFFQEQEVRQLLAGRGVHSAEEVEHRVGAWRRGRATLESAPDWADTERVEILAAPPELAARVAALGENEAFRSTVENLPHEVVVVSLAELVAFQFTVDRPYCGKFTVTADAPLTDLANVTLPTAPLRFPVNIGSDGTGVTISAPGPNLRIASVQVQAGDGGPLRMTVDFTFGSPFVQVAEFHGRMILRNGYHRLVSLLTQGVSHASRHCSSITCRRSQSSSMPRTYTRRFECDRTSFKWRCRSSGLGLVCARDDDPLGRWAGHGGVGVADRRYPASFGSRTPTSSRSSKSHTLSPTTMDEPIGALSCSAAARKRSGSGFACST